MGVLYLVATPIGNLEDITLRALRVLGEVPLIAAEDTRTIRRVLTHHNIPAPKLVSYTERNRSARTPGIVAALDEGDVALVSEAGMPGISDPGVHLVEATISAGHRVVPIPGPSALTAAVAAAGLPARRFHYVGFLPRRAAQRRKLIRELAGEPDTLVAFESPHRLREALADLHGELGDRRITLCRELTKIHEEVFRGTLSGAIEHFSEPRGECTLVIEGAGQRAARPNAEDDDAAIDDQLALLRAQGLRAREAVRQVTEQTGRSRQYVYHRWLALPQEGR